MLECKCIFRIKYNLDDTIQRYKAKLVTKGFQQTIKIDNFETFSSMVKVTTIRIIMCLVVHYGWDIKQIDINNTFLNGDLEEQVYMHQTKRFAIEYRDNKLVCRQWQTHK